MKAVRTIISGLFVVCIPVLLLSGSLVWGFNSSWILEYGFNKFDVSRTTQLSNEELSRISLDWVRYINSSDEYWRIVVVRDEQSFELFTPEEQIHFRDVKNLIRMDYTVMLVAFCLFMACVIPGIFYRGGIYRKLLCRNVFLGTGLTLILTIIVSMAFIIDFNDLFIRLHHLIFTNPYWSASGYMLLLFPGPFWFDAAIICTAFMIVITLILGFSALVYLKKSP
ncbi:MAG: DUF1461 domain-containing protein [Dehalococcoidales bacterium]|nr:DUF1461 domain-containing protein [Dehalococcoidales bacterium]